jgi:hypothetical protein
VVDVSIGKHSIVLNLEGANKFLALKSKIEIPLDNISKVSTEQVRPVWLPRMLIGTHIPGALMAGTFWLKSGKTFYFVKDFSRCIRLHLKNHEYLKVIVQVDDNKETVAQRIRTATA